MRHIWLSIAAGTALLAAASTSAMAFSTYQITPGQSASLRGETESDSSLSVETSGTQFWVGPAGSQGRDSFGSPSSNPLSSSNRNQTAPSRDMGWQGTGYYLRPDR